MVLRALLPALCCAALSAPAGAHDVWLEKAPQSGDTAYLLYSGHRYSAHEGHEVMEYDPAIVELAFCFDDAGKRFQIDASKEYPVRIPCSGAAVFVVTSTGYWTKTPFGTKNISKGEANAALRSWLSYESIKLIDRWCGVFASSLVDELEIVPLADPLSLGPGDKLRLLVTRDGKPVRGAVVAYDGKIRGETGGDGRINVKIRHGGAQRIEAGLTVPLESPDADEIVTKTTLCFELAQKKQ